MARKRPIRLEDLFKLQVVGRVALSPDGRQVVCEVQRCDAADNKNYTNLMLVDVESRKTRMLTEGKHSDSMPKWSPDGKQLGFVSSRDKCGVLYVMPMEGGEPRRVTDCEGNVSDFDWAPNSRRLVYTYSPMSEREKLLRDGKQEEDAKRPQFKHITRLHHKLDGVGWWNGNYAHVYLIGASGGKPKQLTRGDFDDAEPRFSPDGKLVSFVSNRMENPDLNSNNTDIFTVKPTGGAIRKLTQLPGPAFSHSWSPDSSTIAFIGYPAKPMDDWKHLGHIWLIPAKGGRARNLTTDIDNDCYNTIIGDVAGAMFASEAPLWTADSKGVYFLVSEDGSAHLYTRSIGKRDTRRVVDGDVNLMHFSRTAKNGPIALTIGTFTNPADVFVFDPDSEEIRQLTEVNAAFLKRVHVAEREVFTVKSGNTTVAGWMLKPPNFSKARKYPAILEVHGGPHTAYGSGFFHEFQWLAASGYVVCWSNPRGSTSYGLKYRNCIHADWGNLDWKDVSKVADHLFRQRFVDSKRVGITGGSYGGYMTNWAVGHTQRFRAAVTQRSVSNFESMFGTSDFGNELGFMFGGKPWEKLKEYRRQSPLTFVKNIKTPLLIIHSEQDLRCGIEQAEQLFTSLKVMGRETEFVRFEGESHGLSRGGRPQNRAERLRRILGWFKKYMR